MAKKRKLGTKPECAQNPSAESEDPIDEEPIKEESIDEEEPIKEESIDEEEPIKEESIDEEEPINEEQTVQESIDVSIKQEPTSEDDQKPQTLENTDPSPDSAAAVNGDDQEENDPASIQKILELLPKDQLTDLLRDAAVKHPDVLQQVQRIADVDPAHCKIFVHGLGWDTNAETLTSFFRQYGDIEDCNAVTDKITGKSKGYGFILFKNRKGAQKALKEPQKKIGNRMTACQLASAGPVPPPAPPVSEYTQRKIYVSNVGAELDPQKLLQFFAKYGEIEEGPLGLDKVTGKPKGFCLFVYKSTESAKKALEEPHKNFEGHVLHCQKAVDGPKPYKQGFHLHHGSGQYTGGMGGHVPHLGRNENAGFMGGVGNHVPAAGGHLMAPSAGGLGFNQAAAQPAAAAAVGLNPALGQALTALLATQGAGLGLTNLLGGLGSGPVVNQGAAAPVVNNGGHGMQGGYGFQLGGVGGNVSHGVMGGYGVPAPMQGGYGNAQMGQGGSGRSQQGFGHVGGGQPYMGH